MKTKTTVEELSKRGIKTTSDLDAWILKHPQVDRFGRPFLASRYGMLKQLIGEDAAGSIMHELAIKQCCKAL